MLFSDYILNAEELVIEQADNGVYYIEPMWKNILFENQMDINIISDYIADWNEIFDVLKLEVEKRNSIESKHNVVIEWIYELISQQVDPAMLEEETNMAKQIIDNIKQNKESGT